MRRSFVLRLTAAFAIVGLAAALLVAVLVNAAFDARLARYLGEQQVARQDRLVDALVESYLRAGGWDRRDLDTIAAVLLMEGGTVAVEDLAGQRVWAGDSGPMAEMHRRMMGNRPLGDEQRVEVAVAGEPVGWAVVRLPQPGLLPQDVAFRASVNRLVLAGAGVAGVAALGLGALVARRASRPARALTRAAQALAAGDLGQRVGPLGDDEFGRMAAAFDQMAETVEQEDRLRRGFAADVAHELRTPLAVLHGQVEGLQDGLLAAGPAAFASLHEELLRLARLVDDLEAVARADAAAFALVREPVALEGVVEEVARELAGGFAEGGIGFDVDVSPVVVDGDATRLRQVVRNLLSNARKFTPPGGEVSVALRRDRASALLEVRDTGPGIPEDELDHVFDRFFRGRSARAGGSGIGLTVVRQLVEAHGGRVTLRGTPDGGTCAAVCLPAVPQPAITAGSGSGD